MSRDFWGMFHWREQVITWSLDCCLWKTTNIKNKTTERMRCICVETGESESGSDCESKNINMGNSQELFEKCKPMRDYMIFVDKVRKYSQEQTLEDAVEQTIRECMEEDVMADFLGIDAEMIEEIMNDGLIKASQK